MWFQLYVFEDRSKTVDLIRRAEKAGAVAFAVTVDAPVLGRRERDVRNKFAMRAGMRLDNVARDAVTHDSDTTRERAQEGTRRGGVNGADETPKREASARSASRENAKNAQATLSRRVGGRDASLTWSFLRWIKTVTDAPIILKGVTRRDDAARAVDAGVAALWVSNHGGRQLDGAPATLDALPEIVAGSFGSSLFAKNPSARKKVPVIFDGGVRRGADVLKALALGADLVAFGRPLVWGLACGGEEGVDRVIQTLDEELRTAMALCGVNRLDKASLADLARRRGNPPPGRRPRGAYSRL
jgi:isopentenyl diphosphate isomerase/L-lactate dehydrogenase-like FMN-dependent dehydrogenase